MVAISENAKGLENISGERIWTELNKILTGNFIYEILLEMIKLKVGLYIGFPKTCNIAELKNVTERLKKNQITVKPMTVLASLFDCKEDVDYFCDRIKPSSFDRNLIYFILFNRQEIINEKPLR